MIFHWDELARCVGHLLARLLFIVLVTPFLILLGACAYALGASQTQYVVGTAASEFVGLIAATASGVGAFYALGWWFASVERLHGDERSREHMTEEDK